MTQKIKILSLAFASQLLLVSLSADDWKQETIGNLKIQNEPPSNGVRKLTFDQTFDKSRENENRNRSYKFYSNSCYKSNRVLNFVFSLKNSKPANLQVIVFY